MSTPVDLYCEDDGGPGVPLLLIMGIGAQLVWWPPGFCDALRARGFRLVRFDNRDVGLSPHLRDAPSPSIRATLARRVLRRPPAVPYTLADMAADTVALLDRLGLPGAHVVGVSMGGMIAQELAIRHPERVRSLTSVMSVPGRLRDFLGHPGALRALLGPRPRTSDEAARRAVELFTAIGGPEVSADAEWLASAGRLSFARGSDPRGVRRQFTAILATPSRLPALRRLTVPALVVHGARDPLLPVRAGRATARAIPDARYLEVPDMWHALPPSVWDPLADAVADLADIPSAAAARAK